MGHRLLGERDPRLVRARDQRDDRMRALPRHRPSELEYCLQGIEQAAIPVVFQNPPTALDRVIFAVVGRIRGQAEVQPRLLGKLQQAQHELRAPTVVLRPVIQIEHQGRNVGKASAHVRPPLHQAITRHSGGHQR